MKNKLMNKSSAKGSVVLQSLLLGLLLFNIASTMVFATRPTRTPSNTNVVLPQPFCREEWSQIVYEKENCTNNITLIKCVGRCPSNQAPELFNTEAEANGVGGRKIFNTQCECCKPDKYNESVLPLNHYPLYCPDGRIIFTDIAVRWIESCGCNACDA